MARENAGSSRISPILGLIAAVAVLYFARDLLIPLAFAMLLAFLLSPLVKRLESWRIPRAPASLLVLVMAFALLAVVGWMVTAQIVEIAGRSRTTRRTFSVRLSRCRASRAA